MDTGRRRGERWRRLWAVEVEEVESSPLTARDAPCPSVTVTVTVFPVHLMAARAAVRCMSQTRAAILGPSHPGSGGATSSIGSGIVGPSPCSDANRGAIVPDRRTQVPSCRRSMQI